MNDGTELLLYDRARHPAQWTDIIARTQCALFLRDGKTSTPYRANGSPCVDPSAATCVIFDSLEAAERFARERVARFPHLCGDIFDADGRANPPLVTITASGAASGPDLSQAASRRRRAIAAGLVALAVPLIWIDWSRELSLVFPMFLGLGCIIAAVRILQWDLGARSQERARRQRLDEYRRRASHV